MADALGSDSSLLGGSMYGETSRPKRRGLLIALCVITILIAGIIVIIYVSGIRSISSSEPTPAPTNSYLLHGSHIILKNVERISRFRSAVGGSWPGINAPFNHNKTCGSLKHWFQPFDDLNFENVIVYSPLFGKILDVTMSEGADDSFGWDIRISGSPEEGENDFIVQIGHVNITDHEKIAKGNTIVLGAEIGHHIGNFINSDISIINQSDYNDDGQFISMFNVIDHETLKEFEKWNVSNRTYPIITDQQRKLYPLNCTNNKIINDTNYQILPNWIDLNTTSPIILKQQKNI